MRNLGESADDQVFVGALLDLSRRMGVTVVAEWVESEEAAFMLRDWGCDLAAGRSRGPGLSRTRPGPLAGASATA